MAPTSKKMLSVVMLVFFLFTMFSVGVQKNRSDETAETLLAYPGLLYFECVQNIQTGTGLKQEASRHVLRTPRRIAQKTLSLRVMDPYVEDTMLRQADAPREIGALCMMVFLTVIIYIYRTDGKKRFVN